MHDSEPTEPTFTSGLLDDPHHLRADARLAAKMCSLGVVSEDVAASLLKKLFLVAHKAADENDKRALASLVTALGRITKLEQTERQALNPRDGEGYKPNMHLHLHKHEPEAPGGATIEIVHVDDWYGTRIKHDAEENLPTAQPAPPVASPNGPGAV